MSDWMRDGRNEFGEVLYNTDFARWAWEQAARLRQVKDGGSLYDLDLIHIAEELELMGDNIVDKIGSRIATIVEHLVKLEYSPAADPRGGWIMTVSRARQEAADLLDENRSVAGRVNWNKRTARGAANAVRSMDAYGETDAARAVPADPGYSQAQILDQDWWPANRFGHPAPEPIP